MRGRSSRVIAVLIVLAAATIVSARAAAANVPANANVPAKPSREAAPATTDTRARAGTVRMVYFGRLGTPFLPARSGAVVSAVPIASAVELGMRGASCAAVPAQVTIQPSRSSIRR